MTQLFEGYSSNVDTSDYLHLMYYLYIFFPVRTLVSILILINITFRKILCCLILNNLIFSWVLSASKHIHNFL